MKLNSPRGTADIYGEDIKYRDFITGCARKLFHTFGYNEIITPAFEHTELFSRGIGEGTDIVQKEMYTFRDRKGRSLTLRPEGTAPVVRAILEKNLLSQKVPLKLFYIGNMFRYERPQKGRMREFWQVGVESSGPDNPLMDAEVIWLLNLFFNNLGFRDLNLLVNSMGCPDCRMDYVVYLKEYLKGNLPGLCAECRSRYEKNPLRIFDCKVPECKKIMEDAPKIGGYLCGTCREHFLKVQGYLNELGIDYRIKHNLVRGFDYYTRTVFEVVSGKLESAQNALGGGGRYDNLISQFGGPDTPAIGFAVGIDRTAMLMKQSGIGYKDPLKGPRFYMVSLDEGSYDYALKILRVLRETGAASDINYTVRSIKTELKNALRNGYDYMIIIGENEAADRTVTLKSLDTHKQSIMKFEDFNDEILKITGNGRS
ncbi:MAG: histidine--tRNA ligase [Actinobacteria bacterium]|nr:histidine--tRNA ligase [Actinomycetota bacterium]